VRNVHGLLRKNRRILSDLIADGKKRLHKDALVALGYNFGFFTHTVETRDGKRYKYCFEYGFCETDEDFVELAVNDNIEEYS
jgi:hypothetical protein